MKRDEDDRWFEDSCGWRRREARYRPAPVPEGLAARVGRSRARGGRGTGDGPDRPRCRPARLARGAALVASGGLACALLATGRARRGRAACGPGRDRARGPEGPELGPPLRAPPRPGLSLWLEAREASLDARPGAASSSCARRARRRPGGAMAMKMTGKTWAPRWILSACFVSGAALGVAADRPALGPRSGRRPRRRRGHPRAARPAAARPTRELVRADARARARRLTAARAPGGLREEGRGRSQALEALGLALKEAARAGGEGIAALLTDGQRRGSRS